MQRSPSAAPAAVPGCDASTQASGAHDYCYDPEMFYSWFLGRHTSSIQNGLRPAQMLDAE